MLESRSRPTVFSLTATVISSGSSPSASWRSTNFTTFDSLTVPADASAAAEIAAALPRSRVLKAFNTTSSQETTRTPRRCSPEIITTAGLRAIDAGALARARELEALGFLQITLAGGEKVFWTGGVVT